MLSHKNTILVDPEVASTVVNLQPSAHGERVCVFGEHITSLVSPQINAIKYRGQSLTLQQNIAIIEPNKVTTKKGVRQSYTSSEQKFY